MAITKKQSVSERLKAKHALSRCSQDLNRWAGAERSRRIIDRRCARYDRKSCNSAAKFPSDLLAMSIASEQPRLYLLFFVSDIRQPVDHSFIQEKDRSNSNSSSLPREN